ncbi:ABC transporter substrate-binding protein [Undibacterium pigrum]|uniref:ABC-type transport system substrate-binding protein n=1 Tax=Undibacterium pigrum TaxID=401470 RepID=A0A318JS13_9BURK|nr:ABC transporter substrate-binding protein [Undibacterium pigrum]PXX43112.1 ABC-type transport system substrate-binding protein [Undibacterium pigrum]
MSLRVLFAVSLGLSSLMQVLPVQAAGSAEKVLRVLVSTPESSLDPAVASDVPSVSINENIFEPMLRYDYLARPVKLKPNTLTSMPEILDQGKTYVLRLQPGIMFTPDPAFKGKPRELTAEDYIYSIKRIYDPTVKSPWLFMFEGKLLGDEKLRPGTAKDGKAQEFNVQTSIPGLQAVDKYTLRIRLNAPDSNFLFILATTATGAMAKEVVDAYAGQVGNHPIGTGPFILGQWQRSFRIELLANPQYRKQVFNDQGTDEATKKIAASLAGQTLPRVSKVEIKIMEEQQSRVLGFLNNEFDYLEQVPPPLSNMVLDDGKLKPALQQRGIRLSLFTPLQTYYMWMNMEDPVIGGYTPEKIALRRAIALSYDSKEDIALMEKGLAIQAQSPLPPNVLGYDANYKTPVQYNVKLANALLDKFGYKRAADGYRNLPDGQPLHLQMHSLASTTGRLRDEVWRKNLDAIGVHVSFKTDKHSEVLRAARLGKVQMTEANWIADFPDAENFYQLLYGPNAGRANYSRFNLPAFNTLYEQAMRLSDSPERTAIYRQMAQLMHGYTPWVPRIHPVTADILQPWLQNYYRHPVDFTSWRYLDIDVAARNKALK